ncbi:LysR family transcriptional regulator [Halomonas halocynthiae]|uniref:LysR family transcriptional regulator n=1 Tax=Halomonas halocynthiae TaxID=176290 RepID=UPI0004052CB3|nr:LysR family transcriptional regulator [Halomonas halocynthiae]
MTKNTTKKSAVSALSGEISDFDLRLLRIFKNVVECGGFSAAEVELNISRSAISRYMSDLETRLRMRLCNRGRAGFSLTGQGNQVYDNLLKLQADLEKFRSNINAIHHRLVGDLHLGLTDNTISDPNSQITSVIARLKELGPDVTITLETTGPNEIERALIEGRLHIGILPCHQELPGLRYHKLYRETSYLYCGHRHPLYSHSKNMLHSAQLCNHDYVAPAYKPDINLLNLQSLLKPTARAYQMEGIANLILSGHFIGFLPEHYARQWTNDSQMRALLPDKFHFDTTFMAVQKNETQPHLLRDSFLQLLLDEYGQHEPFP